MDPTTHHKSLNSDQVRDLIANGLMDHDVSNGFFTNETFHQHLIDMAKKAQETLVKYERGIALRQIAEQFSWNAFEPEAATTWERKDYDPKTYRLFIGTESEFNGVYEEGETKVEGQGCPDCRCQCGSFLSENSGSKCPAPEGHMTGHEFLFCPVCLTLPHQYTREELEALHYNELRRLATNPNTGSVPRAKSPQLIEVILNAQQKIKKYKNR